MPKSFLIKKRSKDYGEFSTPTSSTRKKECLQTNAGNGKTLNKKGVFGEFSFSWGIILLNSISCGLFFLARPACLQKIFVDSQKHLLFLHRRSFLLCSFSSNETRRANSN